MSTVVVVAKGPVPGRVKTRLTPSLTGFEAAAVAEAALADTLLAVTRCGADRKVVALDGTPGPWLPVGIEVVQQGAGALAERLAHVWSNLVGPAVQIGMDTPQVSARHLDGALSALETSDAALGLADDGGWWAIALGTPDPKVFWGVPMSTPETGVLQRRRLRALGLTVSALPTLRDIDHVQDLAAVAGIAPDTATARLAAGLGVI